MVTGSHFDGSHPLERAWNEIEYIYIYQISKQSSIRIKFFPLNVMEHNRWDEFPSLLNFLSLLLLWTTKRSRFLNINTMYLLGSIKSIYRIAIQAVPSVYQDSLELRMERSRRIYCSSNWPYKNLRDIWVWQTTYDRCSVVCPVLYYEVSIPRSVGFILALKSRLDPERSL